MGIRRSLAAIAGAVVLAACGDSATTGGHAAPDVTLADQNLLHGIFCPPETGNCRLRNRVDLLMDRVGESCPDVVTLQEIWPPSVAGIEARAADVCPFPYHVVLGERRTDIDDELVLSRYPVSVTRQRTLHLGFRRVLWTRIDHPTGPLDVYSTHLASGADGGPQPCGDDCPPECVRAGAATVRDCQSVQMADFIEATHDVPGPALAAGDMNARPGSFVYRQFVDRGWVDTYSEAGNPECDPGTGAGCTSGREDELLDDIESPALRETERIDFVFLVPAAPGSPCRPRIVGPGDAGTGIWDEAPNPFASTCGPLPDALCWSSDHRGVRAGFTC